MDEKTIKHYIAYLKFLINRAHRDKRNFVRVSVKDLEKIYEEIKKLDLDD